MLFLFYGCHKTQDYFRIFYVCLDMQFAVFSSKFTKLRLALPADMRYSTNNRVFQPSNRGEISVDEAADRLLTTLFPPSEATLPWVREIVEDVLSCVRGQDMVKLIITNKYPSDGAGSGLGFGLCAARDLSKGELVMVRPGHHLKGYLRPIPCSLDLEPWQEFSLMESKR